MGSYHHITTGCTLMDQLGRTTQLLRLISCRSISSQRSHSVSMERQTFLVSSLSSPTTGCPKTRTQLPAPSPRWQWKAHNNEVCPTSPMGCLLPPPSPWRTTTSLKSQTLDSPVLEAAAMEDSGNNLL